MDTEKLYDVNADKWARREPSSLSDFTGRPPVFELCGDVAGQTVLDLGAGEGYCSRELARRGAARVIGVELSGEMVASARRQDEADGYGLDFRQGDATQPVSVDDQSMDLVVAVFLYNYLTVDQMRRSFAEVHRVLRPGGRFVFSVPHPALGFIRTTHAPPFYFDVRGRGYFSGVDERFPGEIARRDGTLLPVQMVHKTFADYFDGLREAGFRALPDIKELGVTAEHLALDPEFFGPVADIPLHLGVRIVRT
ncbi:methyltransferase domain-containing protein [uncultured Abyssibacter sp.]|uniref:class I SAM-dependent methyltransferase n=1 Tax=uncultured Abyssibacter sp. TaxID=2320202 RepID=UPI0032B20EC4